jgi:uncharacterized membrane protein
LAFRTNLSDTMHRPSLSDLLPFGLVVGIRALPDQR